MTLALVIAGALTGIALVSCGGASAPGMPEAPASSPATVASPSSGRSIIDLAVAEPDSVIWGADSGDFQADLPGLTTGDFNGDGLADILFGARFGDGPGNSRPDAGEAYVVFGSENPAPSLDIAKDEQGLTIWGALRGDQLGYSVHAGDVNGDGLDDILIGAPFAQDPLAGLGSSIGAAYIIYGSPDLGGEIDLAEEEQDVKIWGPDSSSLFGDSIAVGDVNGNGAKDIIVGATFAQQPESLPNRTGQTGAVFIIYTAEGLPPVLAPGEYDVAIYGEEHNDELGDAVASGDLNGDGVNDIIMAAEAADGPDNDRPVGGEIYVVFGRRDLEEVIAIGEGGDDLRIYPGDATDTLGFSVAAFDLNGDGYDDLVTGARAADGPTNSLGEVGEVHIIYGKESLPSVIDLANEEGDAYLFGSNPGQLLGAVSAGDIDGDGTLELITASGYVAGPGGDRSGAGGAYAARAHNLRGAVDVTAAQLLTAYYGGVPRERAGAAVASADVNGDGKSDVILLATAGNGPNGERPEAGQVYILLS